MKGLSAGLGGAARSLLPVLIAAAFVPQAGAEDIDIFKNNVGSATAGQKPNVLLMIDNGANWSSRYTITGIPSKQAAVSDAIAAVSGNAELVDKVRLGMMLFTSSNTPQGGKLIASVKNFSTARQSLFTCLVYGVVPGTPAQPGTETCTPNPTVIYGPNTKKQSNYFCPSGYYTYPLQKKNGDLVAASEYLTISTSQLSDSATSASSACVAMPMGKTCTTSAGTPATPDSCQKSAGYALEKTNNSPVALSFHEAYNYFKAANATSGQADGVMTNANWEDSPTTIYSSSSTNLGNTANPKLGADINAFVSGTTQYKSPAQANSCASNFIILIGTINGSLAGGEDAEALATLKADMRAAGMTGTPSEIVLSPSSNQSNWGDEYAGFLSRADVDPAMEGTQSITTYVIDVFDPDDNANSPSQGARAYYKSVAAQGKGRYFTAKNADEVAAALTEILNEVQAVNTSFASASMPISMTAETQGTNENQVYIGMFRPDEKARPRWMGNLKRYQYEWDATLKQPFLADVNKSAAYDPVTGFINSSTISYWTAASTYWTGVPDYDNASDSPDGPTVEKGATAQKLRIREGIGMAVTGRKLLTCNSSCTAGAKLKSLALSDASLQNWLAGKDLDNDTTRNNTDEARPSIHGDVLHSRPLVLNYNKNTALGSGEDVVVYYGANDGQLRALRGSDGAELWSMVFDEQTSRLQALRTNAAKDASGAAIRHPYFMDGSPTAYRETTLLDSGQKYISKAWLYLPMRRGGDYIYALDVTDPNDPKYLWKVQGGSGSFATLGQTWSSPKVAKVRAHTASDGTPKPVVFFGAGYDAAAEDYVPTTGVARPARTRGQGLYMVDASTGEILWYQATGGFSVAGDLTLVNYSRSSEGFADRIYFADTGGNIWRADIGADSTSNWSVSKLASFGGSSCTTTSTVDCRKFLYNPSIVVETAGYVSILIGSGDREHPLENVTQNRFYAIRDYGQTSAYTESDLQVITSSTTQSDLDTDKLKKGWYFNLRTGEKVVGNALTQEGVTYFNTNTPATPSATSCVSSLGEAREYTVSYKSPLKVAAYLKDVGGDIIAGGGFPPPPVPMTLKFGDVYWSGVGGLKPTDLGASQPGSRQKTFWLRQIDE